MEKFNVLIQAYQRLKIHRETLCCIIMKFLTANDTHRRHVTQVGLLLSGPSLNWEFTSSRDLFTSLNSEIPTFEQSGT